MWCLIDFETTGLNIKEDRIIEYGVVLYEPIRKKIMATSSQLVNAPGLQLSEEIVEITGITQELLMERSCTHAKMCEIVQSFFIAPGVTHVVAHNAVQFDIPMLQMEFMRQQKSFPTIQIIDTYTDIPWHSYVKNKSLKYAAADHGFLNPWSHRALPDCLTLMRILGEYDYKDIEYRAASPTIVLQSLATYEERDKPKAAGFKWNPASKQWTKSIKLFELEAEQGGKYNFPVQRMMI